MEALKHGDRVKVVDGPRHLLGEIGRVGAESPLMSQTDVYVVLDCGVRGFFRRTQVLRVGDERAA